MVRGDPLTDFGAHSDLPDEKAGKAPLRLAAENEFGDGVAVHGEREREREERVWAVQSKAGDEEDGSGERSPRERRSCLARFGGGKEGDSLRRPILNSSRSPRRYQHPPLLQLPVSPRKPSLPPGLSAGLTWWPCVSCGRPASPSAARELVYSTEHALYTGPCLPLLLPLLLFRTREIEYVLLSLSLSLVLPRFLFVSPRGAVAAAAATAI